MTGRFREECAGRARATKQKRHRATARRRTRRGASWPGRRNELPDSPSVRARGERRASASSTRMRTARTSRACSAARASRACSAARASSKCGARARGANSRGGRARSMAIGASVRCAQPSARSAGWSDPHRPHVPLRPSRRAAQGSRSQSRLGFPSPPQGR